MDWHSFKLTLAWTFNRLVLAAAREPQPELSVDPASARVCCLAHVYYEELWDELADYIRNFDKVPVDLRVNVARGRTARTLRARFKPVSPTRSCEFRQIAGAISADSLP